MVPAVMDLGKSIWQAVWYGIGTESTTVDDIAKHEKVAVVQLVTPVIFVIDMVSGNSLVHQWLDHCQYGRVDILYMNVITEHFLLLYHLLL